jgi:predicted transcriptional regulator
MFITRWQDVSPTVTTNYTVTVTDDNGCQASTSVTIIVNPLPTPIISGDLEICVGETTRLTASEGASYSWSNGVNVYWQDVSPTVTTTYTVSVTDDNGCQASTSVTVVVNPLPTPIISGDLEICVGETTRLTASGGALYSWNNGVNVYWQDVSPTVTTTYTVTVTDDNGCQASTSVTIIVNPLPIPTISGDLEICVGETTRLTASGGASYSWSNGVNVYWQDVSPTVTTTYTVSVTDDNGCQASTNVTVVVNPLPTPTISGDLEICVGETTRLTASGGASYSWSNGVNVYWQDVSPTVTTTYTVTVTDDNGCQASTSVTVIVNPLPTPIISGDLEICVGETTRLTASGGASYSWSNGVNVYWQDVSPTVTTTYTVSVTDDNGCQASTNVTVVVNPLPTPTISGDLEICVGETTRLTASGGASYSWSNGVNVYWQDVSPTVTTTYTVTVTDDNGCQASTNVTVVVNPLPTPTISGDLEICVGETTRLTASGGASYSWSNGVNVYWQDVSPTVTTTYTVSVTDDNGCQASTSVTVIVNPLPTPIISGDLEICVGETTRLTASGGSTFVWSNGEITSAIDVNPTVTTTYSVTVTDANGCQASANVTVVVNSFANATISGDLEICAGESTTLTASGGSTYIWNNGSTTSQITVIPSSTSTYSVTVSTGTGCQSVASVTVTVNALPVAGISGNTDICIDECTTLTATGGVSYEWLNLENSGFSCNSSLVINGLQGGANQSLYNISNQGQISLIGDLGTNFVNGIGFYCQSGRNPLIYGMKQLGTSITEAVRVNFVTVDPITAKVNILGPIPQPPNPYGLLGTTGIMTFIGDISPAGIYYFPAISALIDPTNFSIIDYTFYLGSIDLNNHGNGSNVNYKIISILPNCKTYMDNCIEAFQRFALDPSTSEPSGGIQDWALSPDGETLYSFFGIENGLFRMNLNTATTSCLPGPAANAPYTGMTGVQTDEFGGIYFQNGELYGYQMDRGRFYRINQNDGTLTLLADDLPLNYNGDMAKCEDCGVGNTNPNNLAEVTVCPTETTTYTVIVTDAKGCKSSASITVNVKNELTPLISGDNQICIGESTTLAVDSGNEFLWSNGEITAAITVNPTETTTYSVTVTDINGCTGIALFTVNVNDLPNPAIIGDLDVCAGETAGLFANGGQLYLWNNGATTAFIRVTPSVTATYTVTVTNINGCQASSSVTVVVNPLPTPTISGDLEICVGETTRLTASGGASYSWSNGVNVYWQDVSPTVTTTYTVSVTDDNGCQASTSVTVIVNPLPTPIISGDLEICVGETTRLTASGGSTYVWNNGEITSAIDVNPTVTTIYSVTVTDANGCQASTNVTVVVNSFANATIGGDLEICAGESTTLTASGGSTYIWNNGSTTSQITVIPSSTSTYSVTVSTGTGCQSVASVVVTVNALPVAGISGNTDICIDECTTLTATGGVSYEWLNLENSGFSCNSSLVINGLQGGANQSLYNISNQGQISLIGDLGTNFVNGIGFYCQSGRNPLIYGMKQLGTSITEVVRANFVTVDPITAKVNILGPIPQPPNPYGLLGTTGIMTFIGDISPAGIYYFPAISALIDPTNFSIIDYTFYLGSIDLNNHGNGSNVNYKIISILPNCKTYMDNCIEAFQRFALDPSTSEPSGGIQDWALSPDGETLYSFFGIENGLFRMNLNTATTSCLPGPAANAPYTGMTGVQTDEFGGIYFQNGELYGYQMDRGRFYRINQNDGTLTLLADDLPLNYNGDMAKCEDCGVGNTNPNNLAEVTVCPTETTTYTVIVTDAKGCKSSASITVNVKNELTPLISGDNQICIGESTTLAVDSGNEFLWSNGGITAAITVNPTETTTYSVTVTDINGCTGIALFTVNVNDLPNPAIIGDLDVCAGETAGLFANGGQLYLWNNGATTAFIRVTPSVTATYTVTVTNINGCQASSSVTVVVNPLPTPTISGDLEICVGETTRLTASGGASYSWSNGVNVYWQDVSPTVTTTYTVSVTDDNGCQASTSVPVIVNPLPTPIISGDLEICVGETTRLTASGGSTFVWNNGEITSAIDVNPTVTTIYSVTVTDANGCQASTNVTVVVNSFANATIGGDLEICAGESTTLTASGGSTYIWNNGSTTSQITVIPSSTSTYSVTVSTGTGCQSVASVVVTVNALPVAGISGNTDICIDECTTLTATGGVSYEWLNLENSGFSCNSSLVINGLQGGANQSLYNISNQGQISLIGDLGTNFVNGIGFYCQSGRNPLIYGMKQLGTSITEVVRANFVTVDPITAKVNILGPIPQPPNPYGLLGTTGIMTFIGDISPAGIYYFPAISALIDPTNFSIIDYTFYLGSIDLNNHGNGSNVNYKIISILPNCKTYMDNCIEAFQRFALDPSTSEPSGGIQDWALSPDGETLYSFFGIENGLFRMNLNTATTSCLPGPAANAPYTGMTGVQTDEFGGIYFQNGELYGYQMDRGRFYRINQNDGTLTLLADDLPLNYNGDMAKCEDCGVGNTNPNNLAEVTVCPTETTTYTVIVTDAKGCKSSASITVNVKNELTPLISGDNQICIGESTTLAVDSGNEFLWSNGGITAAITVNPTETTTYSVTVTDINGCTGIALFTVNVNDLPNPAIIGDLDVCAGETAGLFANGGQLYLWNNGATTAFIRVTPSVTATYTVTVTNINGCQASSSVTVVVNPLPTPTISGDLEICVGETTRLTASGGASYSWSNGVNVYWQDVSPTVTTTYTVSVTDDNGCQASTSVPVIVNPLPTPIISGDLEICVGETTRLTASGGSTFVWNNGEITSAIDVNPTVTTTYSVTVTDANGCQASANVTVVANPLPTPSVTGDLTICLGETTRLTATGGTSYVWNNGVNVYWQDVNSSETTTYSVTVTDANGCQANTSVTVIVNPLPTPSISGDLTICVGETTRLTASVGSSYSWSNASTSAFIDVTPTSTTTYSITITNEFGCNADTSVVVTVNELPNIIITGIDKICLGDSTILTATGGTSYVWSTGQTTAVIKVNPLVNTIYSVTVTNNNGCVDSISYQVMIKPSPDVVISGPNGICKGEETFIVVNGISNNSCENVCNVTIPTVLAYWDLEACNSYMDFGTHLDYSEFTAIIDKENCSQVTASTVHRLPGNKHSCTPGFDGKIGMCIGTQKTCNPSKVDYTQALRFQVTVQPDQTGQITALEFYEQSPLNFQFIDGPGGLNNFSTRFLVRVSKNGNIIYYEDDIQTNRSWGKHIFNFEGNPLFKNNSNATYLFELIPYCTVNNGGLESVWDVDDIKVLGGCCTSPVTETMTYLWSNGATTPAISVNPISSTNYSVTVTDCCGCTNTGQYTVSVSDIKADLGEDRTISLGQSITLSPTVTDAANCDDQNPSSNNLKYLWINGATTSSITVTPNVSSFYRVTVTDCNECFDTESITIHIRMFTSLVTYPNPARDIINIVSDTDLDPNSKIRILQANGNTVLLDNADYSMENARNILVNLPSYLSNGLYIIELESGEQIVRQKLVVHKK